jgi:uncharacterized protein with HEPN domain
MKCEQPEIQITDIKKIINTRNRIIHEYESVHGYESVSDDIIWSIVVKHLPESEEEVTNLLKQ